MKLHLNNRPECLLVHSCVLGRPEHAADDAQRARRYHIKIAGDWYRQSLILTPRAVELWDVDEVSALSVPHFERLAGLGAEVVILGTGTRAALVQGALTRPLMRQRIGLEVMDTGAACRTYNILAGDGRKAVAALIA
ncbi:MAG: MTH938/NDUFAF3 family protein [Gammaproteobacteria bacterium]|nr:MTH938/NDUFAF3 family protein [Gammaproteobacteria bacterium]